MKNKQLSNITLFVVGDDEEKRPSRVFMTYRVVTDRAEKKPSLHEFPESDFGKSPADLWSEGVRQVKEKEGLEV